MKITRIGVAVVILLAVVAGGYVIFTSNDNMAPPQQNNTTQNETPKDFNGNITEYAPGITSNETDIDKLLVAHEQALRQNNTTVDIRTSFGTQTNQRRVTSAQDYIVTSSEKGTVQTYSTQNYTITREVTNGQASYRVSENGLDSQQYTMTDFFDTVLQHTIRESLAQNGDTVTIKRVLNTSRMQNASDAFGYQSLSSIEAELTVTESGVIKSANVDIIGDRSGSVFTITTTYTAQQVTSAPSEPRWLGEAKTRVSLVDVAYNSTNGWIAFRNNQLATLPKGTQIEITNATGESASVSLPVSVENGDTVYLLKQSDGWKTFVNTRPNRVSSTQSSLFIITARNGDTEYFSRTVG